MNSLPLAKRLQKLFSDYRIESVIDVGANDGQYRHFLRYEVGFRGLIESFEPLRDLAERLHAQATAEDTNWRVHNCALGAAAGDRLFHRMARSDFSSFCEPIHGFGQAHEAKNTVVEKVPVRVRTLDAEFGDSHIDLRRTFLKLDTQGYDLEVVAGGHAVVPSIPVLQTEISFHPIYTGIPDYKTSLAVFEGYGFSVADLFLVASDQSNRAIEFDCLMVRPNFLPGDYHEIQKNVGS